MVSRRRGGLVALVGLSLAAAAAGCNTFEVRLTPGLQACIAVPQSVCEEAIEGRVNFRAPVELTAFRVTCVSERCTEESGSAEVVLNWNDGQAESFTYNWAG